MFSLIDPESFTIFLTLISYIGFFASGCVGFSVLNQSGFEINLFMISLMAFVFSMVFMLMEMAYYLKYDFTEHLGHIYYMRFFVLLVFGVILLGTSQVGLIFGIVAIITSLLNLFVGLFAEPSREES